MKYKQLINSSLGTFTVYVDNYHIIKIEYKKVVSYDKSPLLDYIISQFKSYFNGYNSLNSIPVNPHGTDFQKKVWKEIQKIPYGEVRTYGQIAKKLDTAAIAVGTACGKNPIPLIIPCHRVVNSKGLSKYSWGKGIETKKYLLELEGYL